MRGKVAGMRGRLIRGSIIFIENNFYPNKKGWSRIKKKNLTTFVSSLFKIGLHQAGGKILF
jgi:hypothetical protein